MTSRKHVIAASTAMLGATLLASVPARADEAVEGPGVEVAPGTVVHPNVGAEAGVINNVFFEQSDAGPVTSGVLRISGRMDVASQKVEPEEDVPDEEPGKEPAPQTFQFRAGLAAAYEEYLYYANPSATGQRNVTFDGQAHLQVYPEGTWSFLADDRLRRDVRPRNYEDATSTDRDDNLLGLAVRFQPGGHQISATARYENMIDVYEGGTGVANRMNQTLGLRGDWQLFPYTKLYADLSYGFFGPLGDAQPVAGSLIKESSNPLRALVGIASTLTEPITLKLSVGWGHATYAMGEGYNAPLVDLEGGYEYSPTGRVVAEYNLDYQDSTDANYYRDHKLNVHVDQQVAGRLLLSGGVDVVFRGYRGITLIGPPDRDDVILAAHVRAQYVLNERYYLTGDYLGTTDQTDYRSMFMGVTDDPSYSRNELMFGARAAF
ncbi:MAG TPA: hypothetical protein VHE35_28510 [Kofleriaceae bacterium]|nr:hypothetical protein [Kofleriaceae bacterium]